MRASRTRSWRAARGGYAWLTKAWKFFPADRIVMTGNPLRGTFAAAAKEKSAEALEFYGLRADLPVVLVVGGSLGTRSLNEMMKGWIARSEGDAPVQVLWQTGKYYEAEMRAFLAEHPAANVRQMAFIERMDLAYDAADLVVSRSGACTVSELCLVGKPTIFVPSPNVAEDHQTRNAEALVGKNAAVMVRDAEAVKCGMDRATELLADKGRLAELARNISVLGIRDAADRVVRQIEKEW